jgi:tryptophan-rich sensory protein
LVLTLAMFILTMVSGVVAIFQLKDTRVALSLATLFLWLIVALTAATFQAVWNADDLYQVGPFVKPRAGLMKKQG